MDQSDLAALHRLNRLHLAQNFALANGRVRAAWLSAVSLVAGAGGLGFVMLLLQQWAGG
ncbi:hypothetical protein [Phenylobacterium sp.]|uniref:hypothetical protein n=1 Tax=Phenylobacterium sp. TaxID=1871053 RepID=UPI002897AE04|nr:hypothetical protein [Phenylobacterium sp.]